MPRVGLQYVYVVFHGHNHLLFLFKITIIRQPKNNFIILFKLSSTLTFFSSSIIAIKKMHFVRCPHTANVPQLEVICHLQPEIKKIFREY